jgi:hypothetical protein
MQDWQQTFIDERGGSDGQNFQRLVDASSAIHEGTNPASSSYNEVRTTRAIVLGAAALETFCQDALIEQGLRAAPLVEPYRDVPNDPTTLDRLPLIFEDIAAGYLAAFKMRSRHDSAQLPLPQATSFTFYEGAHAQLADDYWQARLETGDMGSYSPEDLKKAQEQSGDFNYTMVALFGDNVAGSIDLLVALGASLCIAKQRVCSAEEHTEFFKDNVDVITRLTSVNRNLRSGSRPVLPLGCGYRILQGEEAALKQRHIRADKENSRWRAHWYHPSLRRRNWPRPGHCPASDYNQLRPRTEEEFSALQSSLASLGLSNLINGESITTAQLVIAKTHKVAKATIYQDEKWQEAVIGARAS